MNRVQLLPPLAFYREYVSANKPVIFTGEVSLAMLSQVPAIVLPGDLADLLLPIMLSATKTFATKVSVIMRGWGHAY